MAQRNTYREDEALEEQINLKDILRIGAYLKPYKADVFRILAVVIFMSCIAVSIPYMTKIMIDQIIPAGDMTGLLILGGVTPVERLGGVTEVVRGVTTRTTTGGAEDSTWRELATIRVVDDVIPSLRAALRAKFRRSKNTAQSRSAIRSQVVLELENKVAREIITGYENVTVTADSEDPTRCLVDFSFTVAHGLNQIWLTAHITV